MSIGRQVRNFFNSLFDDKTRADRNEHAGHDLAKTARDGANMLSGPGMTDEIHGHITKGASNYAKSFKSKK